MPTLPSLSSTCQSESDVLAIASAVLPLEHQDLHGVAVLHVGRRLGKNDERVGAVDADHPARAVVRVRTHDITAVLDLERSADVVARARLRAQRTDAHRAHDLPPERVESEHAADDGTDEHLERDERADRIA